MNDLFEQFPFFLCPNNIIDYEYQKDIKKYIYCEKTKTPAYPGSFGDQPNLWIEKFCVIENAIVLRNNQAREKFNKDRKKVNG